MPINQNLALIRVIHPEQKIEESGLAKARLPHDRIGCPRLNFKIKSFEQEFLFNLKVRGLNLALIFVVDGKVFEAKVLELDQTSFKFEFSGVFLLGHDGSLLEHKEKVFYVDARLVYLPKELPHVEKWPCHLHEQGLDHHEITRSHGACADTVSSHQ